MDRDSVDNIIAIILFNIFTSTLVAAFCYTLSEKLNLGFQLGGLIVIALCSIIFLKTTARTGNNNGTEWVLANACITWGIVQGGFYFGPSLGITQGVVLGGLLSYLAYTIGAFFFLSKLTNDSKGFARREFLSIFPWGTIVTLFYCIISSSLFPQFININLNSNVFDYFFLYIGYSLFSAIAASASMSLGEFTSDED